MAPEHLLWLLLTQAHEIDGRPCCLARGFDDDDVAHHRDFLQNKNNDDRFSEAKFTVRAHYYGTLLIAGGAHLLLLPAAASKQRARIFGSKSCRPK